MTYLEGVYWDLDGTIANTELEAHLPAFNNAFNDLGINWNWDTNKYINLLNINGGGKRIAYYAKSNNYDFSEDLILKSLMYLLVSQFQFKPKSLKARLKAGK